MESVTPVVDLMDLVDKTKKVKTQQLSQTVPLTGDLSHDI